MEYVYAAMLLHKAGKSIDEAGVEGILKSAGVSFDAMKVKAMVASIKNINIDDAIAKAAVAPVAASGASAPAAKEEVPEVDTKKSEEEAAAGLGALFG
ncbi:MAG: 50S ribosomal protein L12 [Candidatus ainarchaeum sp.]|nr:50S ribosomal protein L12 [Candidatus ainarchaeum sp.]